MFPSRGTYITRDLCFPGRGTHFTRDTCFLGRGRYISRDKCCSCGGRHLTGDNGRRTAIRRDMCFPSRGTYITRDMCFPGRGIIIIITFIYTVHIQLYSFQMLLTIKDLKIYRKKKKKKKLHYIRKGFSKKVSLQVTFKNLKIGGASKI